MAFAKSTVWARTRGVDEISARTFNGLASITTIYGLGVFAFLSAVNVHTVLNWWEYLGLFLISMVGCLMASAGTSSDSVGLGFIGLSVMAGAMGAYCGPFVGHYKLASVVDVALATIIITLVLGLAGIIYPKSLEHWGSLLMIALMGLIIVQFGTLIFAAVGIASKGLLTIIDWLGVILFGGFIVYDFNRAQFIPKTPGNAVFVGVSIFLDVINLFIRLLAIFGVTSDSE